MANSVDMVLRPVADAGEAGYLPYTSLRIPMAWI